MIKSAKVRIKIMAVDKVLLISWKRWYIYVFNIYFCEKSRFVSRGLLRISSDGDNRMIFLSLNSKFSIPGFFGRKIWQVFFSCGLI